MHLSEFEFFMHILYINVNAKQIVAELSPDKLYSCHYSAYILLIQQWTHLQNKPRTDISFPSKTPAV